MANASQFAKKIPLKIIELLYSDEKPEMSAKNPHAITDAFCYELCVKLPVAMSQNGFLMPAISHSHHPLADFQPFGTLGC